jgi:WD40 repeat protein
VATHADDIMGSPTLRTLQESMLLPWVCFRGSAFGVAASQTLAHSLGWRVQAYELFATAACDASGGQVKLWDLRARRCVRTLSGHANRQQQVPAPPSRTHPWP